MKHVFAITALLVFSFSILSAETPKKSNAASQKSAKMESGVKKAELIEKSGTNDAVAANNVIEHAKSRMDRVIMDFQQNMASFRTGRASAGLLNSVRVDYHGAPMPLDQIATISVPEPALITVKPYDPSQLGAIERAIRTSDLGLNPSNDGKMVRVPLPPMTEERRKEMVRRLNKVAEDHRISIRNVRRDANESIQKLVKDKRITEAEKKRSLGDIQNISDASIQKVDMAAQVKRKELLEQR